MLDVQTDFGTLHQCSRFFEKWCKTAIFWAEFRTELHLFLSRFLRASYDTSNIIDLNIFIKLLWLIFYKVNEISRESFISNYHENDCNTMHMFIEVHFNQFFQADFFRYFHGTAGITLFFQMIGEAGFFLLPIDKTENPSLFSDSQVERATWFVFISILGNCWANEIFLIQARGWDKW